ncbi:MAG: hypothetical protein ABSH48_10240 [Verrucomicrobiota bacterium]|jgi:hypothetical protein
MKLKQFIPQRLTGTIVRQFGSARLVRQRNGQHELIGGTAADRTAACEWVSLFAHEIVFTHFHGRGDLPGRRSVVQPGFGLALEAFAD